MHFAEAQYLESSLLMPGYILSAQGDRMAMAHGVEGRFPFLDSRVVRLANSLPGTPENEGSERKVHSEAVRSGTDPQSPFAKDTSSPIAPPKQLVFQRRRAWSMSDELLHPEHVRRSGIFNPIAVQNLIGKFRRGHAIGIGDNHGLLRNSFDTVSCSSIDRSTGVLQCNTNCVNSSGELHVRAR